MEKVTSLKSVKNSDKFLMEIHLRTTGCHLPYGIQANTPRLNPNQWRLVLDKHPGGTEGWVVLFGWLQTEMVYPPADIMSVWYEQNNAQSSLMFYSIFQNFCFFGFSHSLTLHRNQSKWRSRPWRLLTLHWMQDRWLTDMTEQWHRTELKLKTDICI